MDRFRRKNTQNRSKRPTTSKRLSQKAPAKKTKGSNNNAVDDYDEIEALKNDGFIFMDNDELKDKILNTMKTAKLPKEDRPSKGGGNWKVVPVLTDLVDEAGEGFVSLEYLDSSTMKVLDVNSFKDFAESSSSTQESDVKPKKKKAKKAKKAKQSKKSIQSIQNDDNDDDIVNNDNDNDDDIDNDDNDDDLSLIHI